MVETIRTLLEHAVDYAGLFPPAGLSMADAVERYRAHAASPESWMLGRFVVDVARLGELEGAIVYNPPAQPWRVSVLAGADLPAAIPAVLAFNAHVRDAQIDSIEAKFPANTEQFADAAHAVPDGFTVYWEINAANDPGPAIEAVASAKQRAKIRTGGVKEEMFPMVQQVARFLRCCDQAHAPFKATAGLHHPARGAYRLSYEPGAPSATMHGFVNLLFAAAFQWTGVTEQETVDLLEAPMDAFRITRRGVSWHRHWISTEQIRNSRQRLVLSFGSCSFDEPVADLRQLGML